MKHVSGYQTSDGQFWPEANQREAAKHQDDLNFRNWCEENICVGGEWTASMVASVIIEKYDVAPKPQPKLLGMEDDDIPF